MAKMYGITGLLSGKMGNAVFRARSGQQVVSQYNPVVTNPNTEAQQGGRARFKLVSQLAVVFAPTIKGFGTMSRRSARGTKSGKIGVNAAFVGINYPITTLNPNPTAAEKAVIPMEKVQLTNSNRAFGTIQLVESPSADGKIIEVAISAPQMADGDKAKVVLVGYGTMLIAKSPYVIEVLEGTFEDGVVNIDTSPVEDDANYTVLAFGVSINHATTSRLALDNMQSEEDFLAQVDISTLIKEGAGTVTATIGDNITIGAGE